MAATLTVAATNINDTLASFSNYGPCTAIMAPGRYIMSASASSDTGYKVMSGTSMSTPHVVGMAARYLSQLSEEEAAVTSHERVKAFLSDTSTRGAIELSDTPRLATPDYFLYKTCVNRRFEELETTTTPKYMAKTTTTPQTPTTATSNQPTTTQAVVHASAEAWGNDDIGPVAVGLVGVLSVVVGAGFGLMGFMHSYLAVT